MKIRDTPDTHTDAALAGAAMAPLSNAQKRSLCMLAARAYRLQQRLDLAAGLSLADWRHLENHAACGKAHLTTCANEDYLKLRAHFRRLAGDDGGARSDAVLGRSQPREWARAALDRECRKAADVLPHAYDYARGFVKHKRGCLIEQASQRDIWHAIYTVRRRAQQLRKQGRAPEEGTTHAAN